MKASVPLDSVSVRLDVEGNPIKQYKKEDVKILKGAEKRSDNEGLVVEED